MKKDGGACSLIQRGQASPARSHLTAFPLSRGMAVFLLGMMANVGNTVGSGIKRHKKRDSDII